MRRRQPFLGRDAEAIRLAFPDHALIAGLGLGSVINAPVVSLGRLLGTINVLDAAGRYDEHAVKTLLAVAPILVAPFLREQKSIESLACLAAGILRSAWHPAAGGYFQLSVTPPTPQRQRPPECEADSTDRSPPATPPPPHPAHA